MIADAGAGLGQAPEVAGIPVLAIDDRAENLLALESVLEPLGLDLTTATSGEVGLRLLLEQEFALILLDVRMPGLDGLETAGLIKQREHSREVPIVFMTASSEEVRDIVRGYGLGAVDYVLKPLDPDLLRSKVAVFAQLGQSRRLLKRSEAFLRGAFDAAPVAKLILDAEHRLVRANPAFGRMVGVAEEQLTGRDVVEFCHPEDQATLAALLERPGELPAGRAEPGDLDLRVLAEGGQTTWVAPVASQIEASGPLSRLALVQLVDVTARRRAEHARAELLIEQARRAQAEAAAERLGKLQRLVEPIVSEKFEDLVCELVRRLAEVFEARAAEIEVFVDGSSSAATYEVGDRAVEGVPESAWEEVSLVIEGDVIGRMRLLRSAPGNGAGADVLRDAADRISLMVRRAQLHERERQIALELQRGLLPTTPPELPGVAVAAQFEAAGLGAEVGGDWYDTFALAGDRLGLVIGDVTGSGIRAASLMGQLRSVTRAFAVADPDPPRPADVLTQLHRYHETIGFRELFSVLYLILDPVAKTLVWANAGHPPPLLRSRSGQVQVLSGADSVMCHFEGVYQDRQASIAEGDTLVLYTDGLVERRDETIDESIERLASTLAAAPSDPDQLCRLLIEAAHSAEVRPSDDLTAVVVSLAGASQPAAIPGNGGGMRSVQLKLAPDPGVPAAARRLLERSFGDWLDPAELERAKLAVSELTTNAVCHGRGEITLQAELAPDRLLVEVIDQGPGFEHVAAPAELEKIGGWGLRLVDAQTSRWGVGEGATRVWFEIQRGASPAEAQAR